MKNRLIAGLSAVVFSAAIFTVTTEAGTKSKNSLSTEQVKTSKRQKSRKAGVTPATTDRVVGLIKDMAPKYGVPTWFALRIAKVESGYNPNSRGAAGEYGVFQMKCATAKGIGFSGNCSELLNASTNVEVGLKHLQMAMKLSNGNLKMAASKHNGGLGRKRLVHHYVAMVF
ncbi:MAG TPA: transglycosylase SLT domain-containing protein [Aestuariivirga sp.]|jgi:soluble lytic murein transglycosylase-like protein|nr:transglycosylase SLT domain-containing protein [Hyphomicrobiales bacterium]MCC7480429.1 transglycosylase SLT domain-containing protein [Hyphomicrobiales bacterium]HQX84881.1 transglycosylase SLT domain-containing protein [Aestuariivirga sp.]HQY72265.1 transglycosylase SLT domain-containing protein [Aestuariivirga sp.]HRA92551.1 transglycosylase SLT domain-containing protein [Aestuariivirga sp.]